MSATIWIVTSGEYSDYSVICAAPTEATARELQPHVGGDDITEVPLLRSTDEASTSRAYSGYAYLNTAGQLINTYARDEPEFGRRRPFAWYNAGAHPAGVPVGIQVQAESTDKARHAAAEYAAELGAEIAAGVSPEQAVDGFNARYSQTPEASR